MITFHLTIISLSILNIPINYFKKTIISFYIGREITNTRIKIAAIGTLLF